MRLSLYIITVLFICGLFLLPPSSSAQMFPGVYGLPFVAHYDVNIFPKADKADMEYNKLCPITKEKTNHKVFTEVNGKKIYFCCKKCIEPYLKSVTP